MKDTSDLNWEKMAKIQPPENTSRNIAWRGAWLEGEMIGYAKCMVEHQIEGGFEKWLVANYEWNGLSWSDRYNMPCITKSTKSLYKEYENKMLF